MLARLAENLFWAGRYVERAEHTARMVDVTYHGLLESPHAEAARTWEQLLDELHVRAAYQDVPVDPTNVVRFLVLDQAHPGSITSTIARARENIRSLRELVSSELWEAVNELHLTLGSSELRRDFADQPYELFATVRRGCMTIYGVSSETMPRDDGWRFMALGRLLERAEMTCRLLGVRSDQLAATRATTSVGEDEPRGTDRADFHDWVAVLKSAAAFEAYRRRYRSSMDPADVIEFLLLAPDLPRSVLFCLNGAMHQLQALCGGRQSPALRRLGRVTSSLQYRDVAELFDVGLREFLEQVQARVAGVSDAVADEFFRHHPAGTMQSIATA